MPQLNIELIVLLKALVRNFMERFLFSILIFFFYDFKKVVPFTRVKILTQRRIEINVF